MNVAFPFTDPLPRSVALKMIESVRRHVPGAHVIQMTDLLTTPIAGVDEVARYPRGTDFILWRFTHLADLPRVDSILLDYDVIVQGDLSHVFEREFDLALTVRDETDKSITPMMLATLPHNAGVMFSRAKGFNFWHEAIDAYRRGPSHNGWLDGALAMEHALKITRLAVLDLPCAIYNYTPNEERENVSTRLVVHYKGNRKSWIGGREALQAGAAVARATLKRGFMSVLRNLDGRP